eukprot:1896497-Amphidinium_carterae.1
MASTYVGNQSLHERKAARCMTNLGNAHAALGKSTLQLEFTTMAQKIFEQRNMRPVLTFLLVAGTGAPRCALSIDDCELDRNTCCLCGCSASDVAMQLHVLCRWRREHENVRPPHVDERVKVLLTVLKPRIERDLFQCWLPLARDAPE